MEGLERWEDREVDNVGKVRERWGYKDVGNVVGGGIEVDKVGGWWGGRVRDFWFYSRVGTQSESPLLCQSREQKRPGLVRFFTWSRVFSIWNSMRLLQKDSIKIAAMLFAVTSFFLSHTHSSILQQNKKLLSLFLSLAN